MSDSELFYDRLIQDIEEATLCVHENNEPDLRSKISSKSVVDCFYVDIMSGGEEDETLERQDYKIVFFIINVTTLKDGITRALSIVDKVKKKMNKNKVSYKALCEANYTGWRKENFTFESVAFIRLEMSYSFLLAIC